MTVAGGRGESAAAGPDRGPVSTQNQEEKHGGGGDDDDSCHGGAYRERFMVGEGHRRLGETDQQLSRAATDLVAGLATAESGELGTR